MSSTNKIIRHGAFEVVAMSRRIEPAPDGSDPGGMAPTSSSVWYRRAGEQRWAASPHRSIEATKRHLPVACVKIPPELGNGTDSYYHLIDDRDDAIMLGAMIAGWAEENDGDEITIKAECMTRAAFDALPECGG